MEHPTGRGRTQPDQPEPTARRRVRLLALAVVGLASVTGASAAGLGGCSNFGTLGADNGRVRSCDRNGVRVAYSAPVYHAPSAQYRVTRVIVRGIARACRGQVISVTLHDPARTAVASASAVVTANRMTLTLSPPAPARSVAGVAVVIA